MPLYLLPPSLPLALASPLESTGHLPRPKVGSEFGLTLASKFGFMLESCILASRQSENLICPAHKDTPLSVRDLAPDVVSMPYSCGSNRSYTVMFFTLQSV